jgi:hypothetical protein
MITKFKIFENNTDFKKYFISDFFDILAIFEILNINTKNSTAKIKLLYSYDNEKFVNDTDSTPYFKPLVILNNKILYSSNSLEDCLDVIKTLKDINNYNI